MTSVSKEIFNKNRHKVTCDIVHFGAKNCFIGFFQNIINSTIGSAKFFLPIYIVTIYSFIILFTFNCKLFSVLFKLEIFNFD